MQSLLAESTFRLKDKRRPLGRTLTSISVFGSINWPVSCTEIEELRYKSQLKDYTIAPNVRYDGLVIVAVVSSERLFREGLAAILRNHGRFDLRLLDGPIRDAVRDSRLVQGSMLVVDLEGVSDRDRDFLEGIQVLGNVQTIFIADRNETGDTNLRNVLSRNAAPEELITAVGGVRGVGDRSGPAKRGRPRGQTKALPLAPRQYEVAELAASGLTNPQIAEILNIKEPTVRNIVSTVLSRLQINKRSEISARISGRTG